MSYTSGSHTVFHHRYHIVWITKYRYKVLEGALRERIRTIIRQVCKELVGRVVHSAGYNLFNFTRAFSVVNRQSALACFLLRSASQASTSSFSIC